MYNPFTSKKIWVVVSLTDLGEEINIEGDFFSTQKAAFAYSRAMQNLDPHIETVIDWEIVPRYYFTHINDIAVLEDD